MTGPDQLVAALPPDRWRSLQVALVCVAPLALLGTWVTMLAAKGPYWLGSNLDPDYVYLLNGLNILRGHVPAHVDHPGTPLQVFVALVIQITHWFAGKGDVVDDVVRRPELYLFAVNGLLLVTLAGALVAAGLAALRTTGSLVAGLAVQLLPGLDPVIVGHVICVKPEPLLAALAALVAALVLKRLQPGRLEGRIPDSALFGILVGLAVATKVNAVPLAVLPLLLLTGCWSRALFAGVAVATLAIGTLPAWPALNVFRKFITTIATHSGQYGSGKASVFDRAEYARGFHLLVSGRSGAVFVGVVVVGLLVAIALTWKARRDGSAPVVATRRALLASIAMQVASLLIVARHPSRHYMFPALVMSGLTAAVVLHGLSAIGPSAPRWSRWSALLVSALLVVAGIRLAAGLKEYRAWLKTQRAAQLEVVAELASAGEGQRVMHHYRSSSPAYALHFGDMYTDARWSSQIQALYPNHLYFNLWAQEVERYVPKAEGSSESQVAYVHLTPEILCGVNGETPVVLQGTPFQDLPETVKDVKDVRPLSQRVQRINNSQVEALYRPIECRPDGAEPKRPAQP
jgi:hypothetical protein